MVLTLGDLNRFVCQCFSINEDYRVKSLMTPVYNRPPRKQKSTHYNQSKQYYRITPSRDLKVRRGQSLHLKIQPTSRSNILEK